MKHWKVSTVLSVVLCASVLAGCSIPAAPASSTSPQSVLPDSASSENTNQEAEDAISSAAPSSESVAVEGTSDASNDQIQALTSQKEITVDESDLASYTEVLSGFFHEPIATTKDIPLDYYLSFFLLYQTFENNRSSYEQNENYFWEIPESDLLQTAGDCLGLSDLSLAGITEWPFGAPQNGVCFYTEETSLPYSDATATKVTYDEKTGEASVSVEIRDSQYEDSSGQTAHLVYHFVCVEGEEGMPVYCLQSIDTE